MRRQYAMRRLVPCCLAISLLTSVLASGCGKSALPPPVTVTYRDSIFGLGKVIQITNTSSHHLYNVRVVGRNYEEASSASVKATDQLKPYGVVEVGWMEFEAWTPVPGESVEVYCDDYTLPYISVIPEDTD
ncbi:MAG: hypothetical protein ACYTG0_38775 [Planctomycetota bacterium]|jgi:hypothetical protein